MENIQEIDGFYPPRCHFSITKPSESSPIQRAATKTFLYRFVRLQSKRFLGTQLWQKAGFEWKEIYAQRLTGLVNKAKMAIKYFVEKDLQHMDVAYSEFKIF